MLYLLSTMKTEKFNFFLLLRFCDFNIPYFYYPYSLYRLLLLKIPSWPPIHICTSIPIQTFEDCPVLAEFSNTWRGMQQYRLILTFFNTPRPKNKYLEKTGKLHLRLGTVISLMDWRTKLRFCLLQKFSPQTAVLQFTHVWEIFSRTDIKNNKKGYYVPTCFIDFLKNYGLSWLINNEKIPNSLFRGKNNCNFLS